MPATLLFSSSLTLIAWNSLLLLSDSIDILFCRIFSSHGLIATVVPALTGELSCDIGRICYTLAPGHTLLKVCMESALISHRTKRSGFCVIRRLKSSISCNLTPISRYNSNIMHLSRSFLPRVDRSVSTSLLLRCRLPHQPFIPPLT